MSKMENEKYHTVHFRSIQDPYTIQNNDSIQSRYSTLNTKNVQSMLSGGLDRFYEKYSHLSKVHGGLHLPTPDIRFKDLEYRVCVAKDAKDATVGQLLRKIVTPLKKMEMVEKTILHSMNGIINPGTMTLLLGGPSSGKSTFLKALGGKLYQNKQHELLGSIEYNGLSQDQFELSKLVSLVDQTDDHCPTLTVKETLEFADNCLNGRVEDRHEDVQGVAALRVEMMINLLGLEKCKDTVVGDAMLRGVSGGEKKRVTFGEMLVGGQSIFLCDEVSTGLDSAATFDIMQSLKTWTKTLGGTAVVALLQPPPEVVELFDNILLMSEGYLVYHGPRTSVLSYMERIGFSCPPRIDPADFLVDVTAGRGFQYRNGFVDDAVLPMTPKDFAECFKESEMSKSMHKDIKKGFSLPSKFENRKDFLQLKSVANLAHSKRVSPFAMPFLPSTMLLLKRQSNILFRDKPLVYGKLAEALVVGALLGMIYFNAESSLYLRMLFFSIAVFQRQAWQQITICFQLRSIFYKQRSRNFFRTISYGIADALVQIPINLIVSLVMGSIFYLMSGLTLQLSNYLIFILTLVVYQHAIGSFFTFIGAMSPSITVAQAFAGIAVCFFLLFSGNIILADLIPSYWIWMYWFDPIAWALRCVILNEFTSSRYSAEELQAARKQFQISEGAEYIWIGIAVMFFYYILFTALQTLTLHYVRYDQKKGQQDTAMVEVDEPSDSNQVDMPSQYDALASGVASDKDSNTVIPAYLCINELSYTVPGPKGEDLQLLHSVTANFQPNSMTALMGSSGAGKSTLMDVIAGRKTGGKISGDIIVNGAPKNCRTFSRVAAYCEQMDIHSAATTVREALLFSAQLRLPQEMDLQKKIELVDDTLALLELDQLGGHIVGTLQGGGLSLEQRKRLTIAVELVANPSILFLDEPTSGLDARSALLVMRGVRTIANSGRTVICTIHQPSVQIFELFDSLLLLQRGGHVAYFGELGDNSEKLLSYFDSIPGTTEIEPQYNPATYMLEVIGAGVGRDNANDSEGKPVVPSNFSDIYKASPLALKNKETTDRLSVVGGAIQPLGEYAQYATSMMHQIYHTTSRATRIYWRSPSYNFVRIILFPLFAFIFGSTFFQLGRESVAKVNSQIALIYNSMDFIGVINLMTVLDITCAERAVFYREQSSNMYSAFPYSFALFIAEVPYLLCVSGFFILVEYFMVGLQQEADSFVFFWFIFFLYISICTFLGQWMCALTPNAKVANVAVGALSCFLNLFSGYLLPFVNMLSFYKWVIYIMPSSYTLNALVGSQMGVCTSDGVGNGCDIIQVNGSESSVKDYIETTYGFDADTRFTGMLVLVFMLIFIQACIFLTFKYVNHLKR